MQSSGVEQGGRGVPWAVCLRHTQRKRERERKTGGLWADLRAKGGR